MYTRVSPEWAYTPESIVVFCKNELEARSRFEFEYEKWAELAARFRVPVVNLQYKNRRGYKSFPVLAVELEEQSTKGVEQTMSVLAPGIHVASMRLSAPILDAMKLIMDHPDEKWVLVRLTDDRQIAMSESCQSLVKNATVEQAINRRRQDYWHLPDLEDLNRRTRQELTANDPRSTIECNWLGVDVPTRSLWRTFTYNYRLLQDDQGVLYHLGRNLAVETARSPVS